MLQWFVYTILMGKSAYTLYRLAVLTETYGLDRWFILSYTPFNIYLKVHRSEMILSGTDFQLAVIDIYELRQE